MNAFFEICIVIILSTIFLINRLISPKKARGLHPLANLSTASLFSEVLIYCLITFFLIQLSVLHIVRSRILTVTLLDQEFCLHTVISNYSYTIDNLALRAFAFHSWNSKCSRKALRSYSLLNPITKKLSSQLKQYWTQSPNSTREFSV